MLPSFSTKGCYRPGDNTHPSPLLGTGLVAILPPSNCAEKGGRGCLRPRASLSHVCPVIDCWKTAFSAVISETNLPRRRPPPPAPNRPRRFPPANRAKPPSLSDLKACLFGPLKTGGSPGKKKQPSFLKRLSDFQLLMFLSRKVRERCCVVRFFSPPLPSTPGASSSPAVSTRIDNSGEACSSRDLLLVVAGKRFLLLLRCNHCDPALHCDLTCRPRPHGFCFIFYTCVFLMVYL